MQPQPILHFWFEVLTLQEALRQTHCWTKTVSVRFGDTLEAAAQCGRFAWSAPPAGRLAAIIVLD